MSRLKYTNLLMLLYGRIFLINADAEAAESGIRHMPG